MFESEKHRFDIFWYSQSQKHVVWHILIFTNEKTRILNNLCPWRIQKIFFIFFIIFTKWKACVLTRSWFHKFKIQPFCSCFTLKRTFMACHVKAAFFRQESFPEVHISLRDSLVFNSEKTIMIGRFRPIPAECTSPIFRWYWKTFKFWDLKFQNGLSLKYLSESLKWCKIRKVWTFKFQTPGCKFSYDL